MTSGIFRTNAVACAVIACVVAATTVSVGAADPFLQRAVRDMEQQDAPPPAAAEDGQAEDAESQSPRSAREQREADRRAAVRAKLQAQRDARALAKAERAMEELGPKIAQAERLLDAGRYMEAAAVLQKAAKDVAPLHHPRVQAMLGRLALLDHKPAKALEFVEPVLPGADSMGVIDPRSLDAEALRPLERALLVAGQAHNELAVAEALADLEQKRAEQRRAGKARDSRRSNDFFGVAIPEEATSGGEPRSVEELVDRLAPPLYLPDLDYLGVPIDARSEKPDLSTRAAEHADQALRLFDHIAGTTTGEEQFEAAWRCGRSLALLGRYDDALDAFAFAHHTLRGMHPSDTPAHLKPLADGLNEDRKRVAYLRDVTRYGLEYLLYRRAQEHRLAGRYEQAAAGYRQVIDTAQDTMTRLLIEKLSTDFVVPEDESPGKMIDESPYTAASRLYEALCLIELGKAREAVKQLEAFADEDPATKLPSTPALSTAKGGITPEVNPEAAAPTAPLLFRGQALLELGRLALEHELDLGRAETYFARLDHWITQARADNADWAFSELLPGVKKAAKARTDGPDQEYRKPDFWGNVKQSRIDPGMLVNRKTTPWYLDDLEEDTAKFKGLVHIISGDLEVAKNMFERLLSLDPSLAQAHATGQPSDYSRLMFGANHGYLIAYPQELKLYSKLQRDVLMLADFYYVTEDYAKAIDFCEIILANKFGALESMQRDYPNYLQAEAKFRSGFVSDLAVIDLLTKVIDVKDGTWTEPRAKFRIMSIYRMSSDLEHIEKSRRILHSMAHSKLNNQYSYEAKLLLALDLLYEGKIEEAKELISGIPSSSEAYYSRAQAYLQAIDDPKSKLWQILGQ